MLQEETGLRIQKCLRGIRNYQEVMLCGFCEDTRISDVDSMYKLVDFLEARLKNLEKREDVILEIIRQNFVSFAGLNAKESKTDLDTESWEEVLCYVVNCAKNGVLDIKRGAELYHREHAMMV